jgi:1-acyl-sn-glycerol-3-phosphate acyltransferase
MKKNLIRALLRITGWKDEGVAPGVPRCIMVAYPHTSNWDLVFLKAWAILHDVPLRFMIKDTIMKGFLGKLLSKAGGVPVNRSQRNNLVDQMVATIKNAPAIALCVPPEGTRKKVEYWRSGFYHMALRAEVPVLLSWVDGPRKAFGTGPLLYLTGDMEADLQKMRDYYAPIQGIYPELGSPIRFKPPADAPSSADGRPPESPVLGE